MVPHGDDSHLSAQGQQTIRDGEAAWVRVSSSDWDISAWQVMGAALILLRQQTLRELDINEPYGRPYNEAFKRRLASTKFATMETVTRSNLLYLMEPEIRVVLDRLLASWPPDLRARRTHPTTLAQHVRKELKPKPQPKPASAPKPTPTAKPAAASQQAEPEITLDMISTKTGREQAETFMRQYEKQMKQKEAEIKERLRVEFVEWFANLTAEYREKEKHYDLVSGRHKGFMTKADYTNIMFCIHPDTEHSRSDKQRNAAQQLWKKLEKVMVKAEVNRPSPGSLPETVDELLKRKAEYDAKRAAVRAAKKAAKDAAKPPLKWTGSSADATAKVATDEYRIDHVVDATGKRTGSQVSFITNEAKGIWNRRVIGYTRTFEQAKAMAEQDWQKQAVQS